MSSGLRVVDAPDAANGGRSLAAEGRRDPREDAAALNRRASGDRGVRMPRSLRDLLMTRANHAGPRCEQFDATDGRAEHPDPYSVRAARSACGIMWAGAVIACRFFRASRSEISGGRAGRDEPQGRGRFVAVLRSVRRPAAIALLDADAVWRTD